MLFEYAYAKNNLDGLEALLRREELMGFEVSENYITLEEDERKGLIERFQKAGFEIEYEFGRKAPTEPMKLEELGAVIHSVAECGIDHVIVEQSEIDLLAESSTTGLDELRQQNWFDQIVI
jgi:phosphosulfolactate synthase